jgi:formamidopyrimidine-DNA glycosylase
MPELPEVEQVRLTLAPALLGATVHTVTLHRPDVVSDADGAVAPPGRRGFARGLLKGLRVIELRRHGKQLALLSDAEPVLVVQLGMSGQLIHQPTRAAGAPTPARHTGGDAHVHCTWTLRREGQLCGCMCFRDPRRFGGLTVLRDSRALEARWALLGPDALTPDALAIARRRFTSERRSSRRPIKAALLDQQVIAGVGNIYADESLFMARIDPRTSCSDLPPSAWSRLTRAIPRVLQQAIHGGGSTIRDYLNAVGEPGSYAQRLLVYGRGGQPCRVCSRMLQAVQVAQRTTVFCPTCQPGTVRQRATDCLSDSPSDGHSYEE